DYDTVSFLLLNEYTVNQYSSVNIKETSIGVLFVHHKSVYNLSINPNVDLCENIDMTDDYALDVYEDQTYKFSVDFKAEAVDSLLPSKPYGIFLSMYNGFTQYDKVKNRFYDKNSEYYVYNGDYEDSPFVTTQLLKKDNEDYTLITRTRIDGSDTNVYIALAYPELDWRKDYYWMEIDEENRNFNLNCFNSFVKVYNNKIYIFDIMNNNSLKNLKVRIYDFQKSKFKESRIFKISEKIYYNIPMYFEDLFRDNEYERFPATYIVPNAMFYNGAMFINNGSCVYVNGVDIEQKAIESNDEKLVPAVGYFYKFTGSNNETWNNEKINTDNTLVDKYVYDCLGVCYKDTSEENGGKNIYSERYYNRTLGIEDSTYGKDGVEIPLKQFYEKVYLENSKKTKNSSRYVIDPKIMNNSYVSEKNQLKNVDQFNSNT
ncbi:MAG: hypothetical protein K2N99_01895, partial [Malacoplasma sp.]|nr:hypothetical protein [Malacoplasma sp.]